jgi:rubredoxin
MAEKYVYECEKCGYILDESKPEQPSFEELEKCPKCGADKSSLKRILEKNTKKSKLEKKLKELKEKEKERIKHEEELRKEEIKIAEDVLDYIYDETSSLLKELIYKLTKEKSINSDNFADMFYNGAFKILEIRKKEYYPDNSFISQFRDIILDFSETVRDSFEEKEFFTNREINNECKREVYIESKETDRVSNLIDENEEREKNIVKKNFSDVLKREVKGL